MKTTMDMTKARKSQAIHYCPVCGRKGLVSIVKDADVDQTHYLHIGVKDADRQKSWSEFCIVTATGEQTQVVNRPMEILPAKDGGDDSGNAVWNRNDRSRER